VRVYEIKNDRSGRGGIFKEELHLEMHSLIERFEFEWREVADDPVRMSHLVPGRGKRSTRNRAREESR